MPAPHHRYPRRVQAKAHRAQAKARRVQAKARRVQAKARRVQAKARRVPVRARLPVHRRRAHNRALRRGLRAAVPAHSLRLQVARTRVTPAIQQLTVKVHQLIPGVRQLAQPQPAVLFLLVPVQPVPATVTTQVRMRGHSPDSPGNSPVPAVIPMEVGMAQRGVSIVGGKDHLEAF